jgi:Lhr-like helicase
MSLITVPVSYGEVVDKITILEIKSERIGDPDKVKNVRHELQLLERTWAEATRGKADISDARARLKSVNEELWEIEDRIRVSESKNAFGDEFIELARSVYVTNDRRADIKKEINLALGSELVEEKSYEDYA